jgi:hypothetical protein
MQDKEPSTRKITIVFYLFPVLNEKILAFTTRTAVGDDG